MFAEARIGAERLGDERLAARVVVAELHNALWSGRAPDPRTSSMR